MACSAGAGAMSIEMIGARSLLFNQSPSPVISLMIMLSSQMIGYGWAGLLAPLIVNSPRIVFPSVLPSVTLFNSLYANSDQSKDQVSFFKKVFLGISFYEIFPLYIAPALQAISPWCLALPKTPEISHVFGGSRVGEGLGFLSLSLEWSIIGSEGPLYTPIESQCNQIFAHVVAIFLFSSAYKLNWFDGGSLPFISFELLDNNGNAYKTSAVINPDGTENVQAVEELGLPRFSTSYIIGKAFICLALSAAFSTAVMQNFSGLKIMLFDKKKSQVPIKKKLGGLKEFPMWGFYSLLFCSIGLAFAASNISQSGLSNWGLLVAIMVSFLLSLASGFFYGTTGIRLHTSPVVQVLGGLFFPGNAVGTMWFTTYGASTASQSTLMLKELKLGKYMHIPSFKAVIGQLAGTVIGVFVDFLVFKSILNSKREALLSPEGNGIFSGMHLTSFEAQSITWGIFGKQLYGAGKIYFFVPCFLLAGLFLPIPIEIFRRKRPNFFLSKIDVAMIAGTFYKSIQGQYFSYSKILISKKS
ncbi:OPT oligopeptide transporter protein-domain-containing protein [Phakopsora pachyrhizi]|uniref:OPT oligopeptide transporter protein-domain-containing protein n=1 Tax=Phakopsora pachyrhizi TaxID=170000 RepID=A0AAV0ASK0_PHAPC|nr:OPT oligopeptide transporter protein-domain-containing protein [Phakopsora pachyrhizi]